MKTHLQAILAGSAIAASTAGTINCDINRSNTPHYSGVGVAPANGTIWNSLVAPTAASFTQNNLSTSAGIATATSVTITRTNGQTIKTWDDSTAGNPNPADLMREYLYQGPYTVTLDNLSSGAYTLYVFAHGNNTGQNSTITLNAAQGGASGTTIDTGDYRDILQPGAAGNTYLALTGTVGAAGTFTFTTSSHLNGFQLHQHPVNQNLPDGFGSAATGGAGGPVYTVTNSAQLLARATSAETCTINLSGIIEVAGGAGGDGKSVRPLSNKTIQGMDANSTLIGGLDLSGVNNIIVRNLRITHPGSVIDPETGKYTDGGDGISVWAATDVHISHCTIYDCADGGCDITRGSDRVTVSWCKFYYTSASVTHRFPMILGNTDESDYHVTLHHNWFAEGCDQRMPSGSYSRAHLYNNYFSCSGNSYCTNVRTGGEFLVENNYYAAVKNPCYKQDGGKIFESGNIFQNCSGLPPGHDSTVGLVTGNDTVFTPPYAYSPDLAAAVPAIVMAGAGNMAPLIEATNDWGNWKLSRFTGEEIANGAADPDANPDGDTLPNLAEYALGTDPKSADHPFVTSRDGNGLSITFTRPAALPGVSYAAESSDDLDSWNPAPLEVITPGTTETVRVADPLTDGDPRRRFIRLVLSTP